MSFDWLPPLLLMEDDGHDWGRHQDRVYAAFEKQFATAVLFRGRRVSRKRYPMFEGRSRAFWHLITENPKPPRLDRGRPGPRPSRPRDEDRLVDFRRTERIAWIRPMIEAVAVDGSVRVWWNDHRGQAHWLIALPDFSYLVVLDDHTDFLVLATAYPVHRGGRRDDLETECEGWTEAQKKLKPPSS